MRTRNIETDRGTFYFRWNEAAQVVELVNARTYDTLVLYVRAQNGHAFRVKKRSRANTRTTSAVFYCMGGARGMYDHLGRASFDGRTAYLADVVNICLA